MKVLKGLTSVGLTLSMLLSLAACSSAPQQSAPAPAQPATPASSEAPKSETPPAAEKVKLVYARGKDSTDSTKKLVVRSSSP